MSHEKYVSELLTFLSQNVVLRALVFLLFFFFFPSNILTLEYTVSFLLSITETQIEGAPASTDAGDENESKTSCSCNFL